MMEKFCRGFLLRHTEYEHLHVILDNYRDRYDNIDAVNMFCDKESLTEKFPAISRTLLRMRGGGQSHVLALLGFAFHVHTTLQNSAADWYDIDILLKTLIDILMCNNFNPASYCKPTYCTIL